MVDDYDVVVLGVAQCSPPTRTASGSPNWTPNGPLAGIADIVLYDSFAQPESDHDEIVVLIYNPRARRVVVYTWNFHPDLILNARRRGVHGYLSKTLAGRDLVMSDPPPRPRSATGAELARRGKASLTGNQKSWP